METAITDLSTLPRELLALIAQRLPTRIDKVSFRAVCHSFRTSSPPPPKTPSPYEALQIPYPINPNPNIVSRNLIRCDHLLLTHSTLYAIEPLNKISQAHRTTKTWVVKLEESDSGKLLLKDPLGRSASFRNLSKLPKFLNVWDYRVKEVATEYGFEIVNVVGKAKHPLDLSFFTKVVVSTNKTDAGFAIMATYTLGKLAVWRYGDKNWTNIEINRGFEDIIYHNNNFYAVDSGRCVITVDPKTLKVNQIGSPVGNGSFQYLVKSSNDLLLVDKYLSDDNPNFVVECSDGESWPIYLNIFKLDEDKCEWVQVMDGLKDRVLFIGFNCSFSLSAIEFRGCKSNSVYLTKDAIDDDEDDEWDAGISIRPGYDSGIFDLEDGTAAPLSAFPGYSKLFWPPPTWLKLNSSSPC